MKKFLFTAFTALTISSIFAQTPVLEKTCYRGAFAPAPTPMWTGSWTNWDPQNTNYPAPTKTITGNITSSQTWNSNDVVLLSAQCFVKGNSVLTIQPGCIILGDKAVTGAGLFITTGSKLIANGTAAQPIVFTSNQATGQRAQGDWGGVILMGLAKNNAPAGTGTLTNPAGTNYIEGLPVSVDTQYGGSDDNDNSGSLKYVRIEFGGYAYQPSKEINGLTFGAVGRGTTIDYIQVSYSNDDSYEWFGGTVNCKHLVAYRGLDDDFDTDNGFSGVVQFGLGVRDPQISDDPAISTSEGFESDNDPNGTTATPQTSAIFSNITHIGPLRGDLNTTFPANTGYRRGARIRRNSALKIVNSIFTDDRTRGVFIDGNASEGNMANGTGLFTHNILAGYGQRATETQTTSTAFNATVNVWIASTNDTLGKNVNASSFLTTPYNYTAPDYRPIAGSIATSGASFTNTAIAAVTSTASANVSATIPSSACIGSGSNLVTYTFAPVTNVDPGYCSLSWSASSGISISNTAAVNPTFSVSTIGSFSITLTVANGDGTTNKNLAIITATCLDVSVKENNNLIGNVSLYPNPTSDAVVLTVNTQQAGSLFIAIYDITGKVVATPVANDSLISGENKFAINTTELNNGIYFVTLNSSNGKATVKLIVNK